MEHNTTENNLAREIEANIETDDIELLRKTLLKLLTAYQKQARRTDKMLALSDRQQARLLELNEKLDDIHKEQLQSIDKLVDDKRIIAKNMIESKKKIFELNRQNLLGNQSGIDELTKVIIERDEAQNKLDSYMQENAKLRKELDTYRVKNDEKLKIQSEEELHLALETLSVRHDVQSDMLAMLGKLLDRELNFAEIDNFSFSRNGLNIIKNGIYNTIAKYDNIENPKELAGYAFKKYIDEILYVCSDKIIDLLIQKNQNASNFVKFYDGEIGFTPRGTRFEKPEIKTKDGTRWHINTIYQFALRYKTAVDKIKFKQNRLETISKDIADLKKKMGYAPRAQTAGCDENGVEVQEEVKAPPQLNPLMDIDLLTQELEALKDNEVTEQMQLKSLKDSIAPIEEKYEAIVVALARAMVMFKSSN